MSKTVQRQPSRREQRRDRKAEQQRLEERRRQTQRRRRLLIVSTLVCALLIALVIIVPRLLPGSSNNGNTTASSTSSAAPVVSDNPVYPAVNNIACSSMEQLSYHVHAHLTMYINGQPAQLPAQIGIAPDASCLYWMHTHDTSGVLHIEAPQKTTYKFGTFLQLWHDRFGSLQYPAQLDSTNGWQVYVNGDPYTGNFADIPLDPHTLITMAYNSPDVKPDKLYNWNGL